MVIGFTNVEVIGDLERSSFFVVVVVFVCVKDRGQNLIGGGSRGNRRGMENVEYIYPFQEILLQREEENVATWGEKWSQKRVICI
jgi:hypothetical protein